MQTLEINGQRAIVCETLPDLITITRSVVDTFGEEHPLVTPPIENDATLTAEDRRLTLRDLETMVNWEDPGTKEPIAYPLIGEEAEVVINALTHQARQPESWLQASAAEALEEIGKTRTAKISRFIAHWRTRTEKKVAELIHDTPEEHVKRAPANGQVIAPRRYSDEEIKAIVKEVPSLARILDQQQRITVDTMLAPPKQH